jgi:hypothetical protein
MGAIAIVAATCGGAFAAASAGPAVTVVIRTPTKILVNAVVHGEKGSITKGGTPAGVCPGMSAAGALDAATHGKWKAKYYSSFKDVLVTSVLGITPKRPGYWKFLVNGKVASVGVCAVKLKAGQKLQFRLVK